MVPTRNMLVSSIFIQFKLKSFIGSVIKRITLLLSFSQLSKIPPKILLFDYILLNIRHTLNKCT